MNIEELKTLYDTVQSGECPLGVFADACDDCDLGCLGQNIRSLPKQLECFGNTWAFNLTKQVSECFSTKTDAIVFMREQAVAMCLRELKRLRDRLRKRKQRKANRETVQTR